MLEKSINDINIEIVKLEKQYLLSSRELHRLKIDLIEKMHDYDREVKRLRDHEKELFITEKKFQAAKNKIAFLKSKLPSMGSGLSQIDVQLQASLKEIDQLNRLKKSLEEQISTLEQSKLQALAELSAVKAKNDAVAIEIENAEAEKAKILGEISKLLSTVSQNKIQSEKELDRFSIDFARLAGERELVRSQYLEAKDRIEGLNEELALLDNEQNALQDILEYEKKSNHFRQSIDRLEKMETAESENVSDLELKVSEKKQQLETLISQNKEQKEKISILEDEIENYDKLMVEIQDRERAHSESKQRIQSAYSDLARSFDHHSKTLKTLNLNDG